MSGASKPAAAAQILVVEDSSVFREMQGLLLRQAGYGAWLFESPKAALIEAAKQRFDLVVIDYELPDMNGEQFMHALRSIQPNIAVIFVSGSLTLDLAIKLSSQGVAGIFNKPANPKTLLEKITETLSRAARDTAVRAGSSSPLTGARATPAPQLLAPASDQLAYEPRYVFGESPAFREFTHRLWKVRDFRAVLLLQGESGSPFESFARELAAISMFHEGPVMTCDASAFEPRRLIEVLAPSLLSHDAGTLIVTGVEDLTAAQQATLENLTTGRDVFLPFARRFRLVLAATARLAERVEEGTFGETLYYKISSLSLSVPALREMRDDVAVNARRILEQLQQTVDARTPNRFTAEALTWLGAQEWPGNYAQLRQCLADAAKQTPGAELDVAALESAMPAGATAALPAEEIATPEPAPAPVAVAAAPAEPPAPPAPAAAPLPPRLTTPARTGNSARPATTRSLFRPTSGSYNFGKRLSESIALADAACAA